MNKVAVLDEVASAQVQLNSGQGGSMVQSILGNVCLILFVSDFVFKFYTLLI